MGVSPRAGSFGDGGGGFSASVNRTETTTLAAVHQAFPHLKSLAGHVRDFAVMLTTLAGRVIA